MRVFVVLLSLVLLLACRESPEELVHKAIALREQGRYQEAKKILEEALAIEPTATAYKELGNYYLIAEGNLDEAERNYQASLKLNPTYLNALHNMGTVYLNRYEKTQDDRGRGNKQYLDTAYQYLKQAMEQNPNFGLTHQELARYFFYAGQIPQALESIEKAIKLEPKSARAYLIAGQLYLKGKKDLKTAHEYFERAYAFDRKLPDVLYYLHLTSRKQNKTEDAIFYESEYRKLLEERNLTPEEIQSAMGELRKGGSLPHFNIK
ncbi:MAG: tetratricopeptide repeat protein [Leptospiraceae bacterium]|nr:tetratricopeptide repeat protein [Leptospiraceae bacterium]MDW8305938.1 tetratricopeptide repeat protein [Leptospiraceae bacterium]